MIGEIDILENVNGASTAWQTIHCGPNAPGVPCNEYTGVTSQAAGLDRSRFHKFSVDIDRTNPGESWKGEKVVWRIDGNVVFTVDENRVNNETAWTAVTRTPKFMLLNVAVGGSFPDNVANPTLGKTPTSATVGGKGSAMEVRYVAILALELAYLRIREWGEPNNSYLLRLLIWPLELVPTESSVGQYYGAWRK
ncbi:hypothetical protein SMACR_05642 [Sordaria macrospora]|uniref:WGS project CABT00000000 data, contig 2.30 n=2 Tax=Sordaria macrospora TaxID=5147 RepID=F7W593_SORMK|nr:uncharacterized protein SMAC_05642 [Sordaria macrospora k-hell]KAA8623953.1 hypothetical protein SMACR_05642 [Sordaria macrospora]WPJ62487.1 hypothetical protein SMAC4_05642 [Sordaria macrospora]CCC12681.1 unnamed protein product [Sordaria macrospora k-hell]